MNAYFPNQSPKLEVTRQGYYYYDFCFTDHKLRRSWWIYAETYIYNDLAMNCIIN